MAYAFNDDKSKVEVNTKDEVYSKDDLLIIRKSQAVSRESEDTITVDLSNYGITLNDLEKYTILSVNQYGFRRRHGNGFFNGSYGSIPSAGITAVSNKANLNIRVKNDSSTSETITGEVILLKTN